MNQIVVIGAGPKGLAIAAKWTAYRECGYDVPFLTVIDRVGPGANWRGQNGYTDGHRLLCTMPERDVGFPYQDTDSEVSELMLQKFSWQAFQIATRRYPEWIDRDRPQPRHTELQEYFLWVAARCPHVTFTTGNVFRISAHRDWRIDYEDKLGNSRGLDCDVLVLTGTGEPMHLPTNPSGQYPRVLNGLDFWQSVNSLSHLFVHNDLGLLEDESITVIGSGGTAATIVAFLAEKTSVPIKVVSRSPALYSRGENYTEVRFLIDPLDWTRLPLKTRRELLQRIDRGVVSAQNMRTINGARNVVHYRIAVSHIAMSEVGGEQLPSVEGNLEVFDELRGEIDQPVSLPSSFVIDATGFDPWWFRRLFDGELSQAFGDKKLRDFFEEHINDNLAVPIHVNRDDLVRSSVGTETGRWLGQSLDGRSHLHMIAPMLAGLAQGPGFPNLTCLGLLANRVLEPFVR